MDVSHLTGPALRDMLPTLVAEAVLSQGQIALIVVILAVTTSMTLSVRRRRLRDANSPRAYAREQLRTLREEEGVRDDLNSLMAQVQDITRQMNAQLDAKFAKLECAVRDADNRIARLDRLAREADGRPVCDVTIDAEPSAGSAVPSCETSSDRYAPIYQMADSGLSSKQIAERTGKTAGEIELILALRPGRTAVAETP